MDVMDVDENWKVKTLLLGGLIGTLTGLGAAYLLIRQAERAGEMPKLGAREGAKLGVGLLSILRQLGELGEGG
jgi:hypothetical protein